MSVINPVLYFIRTDNDGDCFILKLDETNNWQIDSGSSLFPSYQNFKSAVLKRKITNFKGIIITNPRQKHLDGMIRFLKECFSPEDAHTKEFPNLDFRVVLTEEFRNNQIIDILSDNGFEIENKEPKFEYQNLFMECFFHENGKPLILRHRKSDEKGVNAIDYNNDNMTIMENNATIQTDLSSILTYLQYLNHDGIKKSMFLTSDNIASWIQKILTTKINIYQKIQRPSIDIFQVPHHGSRFNSIVSETYINPPKYVHQQFALMVILYHGGQFDFKGLNDKIDIEADFEIMLNFTNFEIFKKAALLDGYIQTLSNPTAIKHFLKHMAKALVIRTSTKNINVDWDWNEINWSEVAKKLYIIYKMNQTTESCCWPKYDFIKDVIDIPKKDIEPYFNNTTIGNITEEQLDSYFNSIKERIYENFDIIICTKHKNKIKHRPPYATHLRPLLNPMWDCLDISPLTFRYIASSISNFYKSFIAGTYIISSGSRHGHPSPLVIIGIIKSILEDVNEMRNARILLTSGSKINMNLLASAVEDLLENESYDIYKLLNQRIKIYSINDSSYEVGIKLSDGEFEDPKSVKLLNWNSSENVEIKKISNIIKNIPEQPIDKFSKSFIKILTKDKQLWLGVSEKGDLAPSDRPVLFWITNVPFLDQKLHIVYLIVTSILLLNSCGLLRMNVINFI